MNELILAAALSFTDPQMECLAKNVYFEARNQPHVGQVAVAEVVLNRVDDYRYPDTVCEVVEQGYRPGRRDCQFSWFCDGLSDTPYNEKLWQQSLKAAQDAMDYRIMGIEVTNGATHYHAKTVNPKWAGTITKVVRIDDHIFYRWEK